MVEILEANESKTISRYPYVGRAGKGTIVYFVSRNRGLCIASSDQNNVKENMKDIRDYWDEDLFSPISVTINSVIP